MLFANPDPLPRKSFAAGLGSVLYWVSNPLWVGGSLAFVSTAAWSAYIHPIGTKTAGDYADTADAGKIRGGAGLDCGGGNQPDGGGGRRID